MIKRFEYFSQIYRHQQQQQEEVKLTESVVVAEETTANLLCLNLRASILEDNIIVATNTFIKTIFIIFFM